MTTLCEDWGLQAPILVHRFLALEPDVKAECAKYLRGEADEILDVFGPPTQETIAEAKRRRDRNYLLRNLPKVTMRFVKSFNPHSGVKLLQIIMSPADQEIMASWLVTAGLRRRGEFDGVVN